MYCTWYFWGDCAIAVLHSNGQRGQTECPDLLFSYICVRSTAPNLCHAGFLVPRRIISSAHRGLSMTPLMQSRERRGSSTSLVLRPAPLHPPTSPSSIEPLQAGEPPSPTRSEIGIHWCSSITRPATCARHWTERRLSHAEATRTHIDCWQKSYVGGYMRATSPRVLHTCLTPSPGCHPASFFATEATSATHVIFMPRWSRPTSCPGTRYRTVSMVVMVV